MSKILNLVIFYKIFKFTYKVGKFFNIYLVNFFLFLYFLMKLTINIKKVNRWQEIWITNYLYKKKFKIKSNKNNTSLLKNTFTIDSRNFFFEISNLHGLNAVQEMKIIMKSSAMIVKLENKKKFLINCKYNDIIPKSLCYNFGNFGN